MAARITSAEAELIWRDYPPRLATSYGRGSGSQAHVLVRLRDDGGRTGYGEASPLPSFTGETGESIVLQLRKTFLPLIVGQDPYETEIGCAASLALALAAPTAGRANDLGVFDRHGGLADTRIRSEGGAIVPGDEPGLGVRSIPELAGLGWESSPGGMAAR